MKDTLLQKFNILGIISLILTIIPLLFIISEVFYYELSIPVVIEWALSIRIDIISCILSIVAIVFGILGLKHKSKWTAIVGITLNIIPTILFLSSFIYEIIDNTFRGY